jgi:hypothetical protein
MLAMMDMIPRARMVRRAAAFACFGVLLSAWAARGDDLKDGKTALQQGGSMPR